MPNTIILYVGLSLNFFAVAFEWPFDEDFLWFRGMYFYRLSKQIRWIVLYTKIRYFLYTYKNKEKKKKNCQPTYYIHIEWSKLICSLIYPVLRVQLPWLLVCIIYIYTRVCVCILLPNLKWWLLADMSLWPCHHHHHHHRNFAGGLWWFMREQMPLTLHRMRERRSNIDIWNRRKEERKNVYG